jgi:hypothetical protein
MNYKKESRKKDPEKFAAMEKQIRARFNERNKAKVRAWGKAWELKNRSKLKEKRKVYGRTTKLRRYGLTKKDYETMLIEQNNVCAICGNGQTAKVNGKTKPLFVDHCHNTNQVRGLLCHTCNRNLAVLDNTDWVAKATVYLQQRANLGNHAETLQRYYVAPPTVEKETYP